MTDEDILERAFLSALQKHFKKPGPWITERSCTVWPKDGKGVPKGQVWEVFLKPNGMLYFNLNGVLWAEPGVTIFWLPRREIRPPYVDQWLQVGAGGDGTTYDMNTTTSESWCPDVYGYIFTDEDSVTCSANTFICRARRRFDQET